MTAERVRSTARERAVLVTMILIGGALPVAANAPVFHDVVWVFWLAGLAVMLGALVLVLSIVRRERRSRES